MESISLREAADQLGIVVNTLRRWWGQLLIKGYMPEVEQEGKRILLGPKDIEALQSVQTLYECMTLEEACLWVTCRYQQQPTPQSKTATLKSIEAEVRNMDTKLQDLPNNLYWQGQEKTIQQLQLAWDTLKQKL